MSFLYEIKLLYCFIQNDLWTTIFPGIVILISDAFANKRYNLFENMIIILNGFLYIFFYTCTFCISNQLKGIEEDRINKPFRPLVTGKCTLNGAWIRLFIVHLIFLFVGIFNGVIKWCLVWIFVIFTHNLLEWSNNWFWKSFSMFIGVFAQLSPLLEISHPLNSFQKNWIFYISFIVFFTCPLQDLRDITGDLLKNRKTLPIILGEKYFRYLGVLIFLITPFFLLEIQWVIFPEEHFSLLNKLLIFLWFLLCFLIVFRLIAKSGVKEDHKTYRYLEYLFTTMIFELVYGNFMIQI